MPVKQQALGFWRGFGALFGAARSLLGMPAAWPYALVPAVMFTLLQSSVMYAAWHFLKPWADQRFPGESRLQEGLAFLAFLLPFLIVAVLGWFLSGALAPSLSGPALERLVTLEETQLRVPPRAPLGFFAELWCGLRSMLLSVAVTLPVIAALSLLELLFAPAAVVVTPLKLLIGALGVAWGLFDYPMTLRGVAAGRRARFMKDHLGVVLGFGAAFALVFYVPCCGIVMLPVGAIAATRLVWDIERSGIKALGIGTPPGSNDAAS